MSPETTTLDDPLGPLRQVYRDWRLDHRAAAAPFEALPWHVIPGAIYRRRAGTLLIVRADGVRIHALPESAPEDVASLIAAALQGDPMPNSAPGDLEGAVARCIDAVDALAEALLEGGYLTARRNRHVAEAIRAARANLNVRIDTATPHLGREDVARRLATEDGDL